MHRIRSGDPIALHGRSCRSAWKLDPGREIVRCAHREPKIRTNLDPLVLSAVPRRHRYCASDLSRHSGRLPFRVVQLECGCREKIIHLVSQRCRPDRNVRARGIKQAVRGSFSIFLGPMMTSKPRQHRHRFRADVPLNACRQGPRSRGRGKTQVGSQMSVSMERREANPADQRHQREVCPGPVGRRKDRGPETEAENPGGKSDEKSLKIVALDSANSRHRRRDDHEGCRDSELVGKCQRNRLRRQCSYAARRPKGDHSIDPETSELTAALADADVGTAATVDVKVRNSPSQTSNEYAARVTGR